MSTIIKVRCTDQVLTFDNTPVIASGGLGEDFIVFDFCSKWDGFAKTAVFWRTEADAYHVVLDENGSGAIPPEVLTDEGVIYFGVFGVDAGGNQRTSEVLNYRIVKGAITTGTKPSDPTPDIYIQIEAHYAEVLGSLNVFNEAVTASAEAAVTAQAAVVAVQGSVEAAQAAAENAREAAENTVNRAGDTIPGNLTVNNDAAPYVRVATSAQGSGQFTKNASTTSDNGTQVIDNDASGNRAVLQLRARRWNFPIDVLKLQAFNADRSVIAVYDVYHTGNVTAGTTDITAGSTALATGSFYDVYE